MSIDDVRQWHRERYRPDDAVLSVVGDVDAGQILNFLEQQLSRWEPAGAAAPVFEAPARPGRREIHLVDRPGAVQATLLVGNLAIRRDDEDYPALRVMNELLGGATEARLPRRLQAPAVEPVDEALERGVDRQALRLVDDPEPGGETQDVDRAASPVRVGERSPGLDEVARIGPAGEPEDGVPVGGEVGDDLQGVGGPAVDAEPGEAGQDGVAAEDLEGRLRVA